jgi:uncharacterized repeat protein (TIGR01451 family)
MGSRYSIGIAVCIVAALLALPLFIGSAVSPIRPIDNQNTVQSAALANSHGSVPASSFNFLNPLPQAAPVTLDTYAGDCTTQKSVFNIQNSDKTVCAKFTNALPGWRVIWSNARFVAVQTTIITAPNSSASFTLSTASSLGDWRVIIFDPFGGTVQTVKSFTVIDEANPTADLSVSTSAFSESVSSGGQALFAIQVTNLGPSAASAVQLTDAVPAA